MTYSFRQFCVVALVVIVLVMSGSACQNHTAPTTAAAGVELWRFALEEVPGSVQDAYAQKFKALIEERSAGKVKVIVYPYGALGTSDHVTELLHMGAIQFAMASPGHLGKLIPEVQLLLLHFIFSEHAEVNKAVLGHSRTLIESFDALYRAKGLQLLAFYPEGWQVWTTNRPIHEPADFAGLKMRVMTSPILIEAYKAYNANPTPLPYGEVYSALQLRMIDGQVNPVFAIEEMSFYEVTDYMTFAKHAQFVTSVATNPRFFEHLPHERQQLVQAAVAEANDYIFAVQSEFNTARLQKITKRKPGLQLHYLTAAERERFKQASLPVRQIYTDMVGPTGATLLTQILHEVARAEAQFQQGEHR
ncbi:MAG: TRAP transporter substrate-binding protein DctP [Candidatus Binatia bacterium]